MNVILLILFTTISFLIVIECLSFKFCTSTIVTQRLLTWCLIFLVGPCKSTFHQFIQDVMESVQLKVASDGTEVKPINFSTVLHLGQVRRYIFANSGARSFGLFDELVSFFTTMNMYSSSKMQVSDTKEYHDFLQMFTGKTKTRETSKELF